jgi:hypothetical protein
MPIITRREDIIDEIYQEIFIKESHHNHKIIHTNSGFRWVENEKVTSVLNKINLNHLIELFYHLGIDKNNEVYRKLYRDMGYSLKGYWEIFYWEVNNPKAKNYNPKKPKIF